LTSSSIDGNFDGNSVTKKGVTVKMLSNSSCKNAKPNPDKAYKLVDEKGLYLLISKNGGKWWRFDYRFGGKRKTLSMGTYPDVSLKSARDKRDEARTQIAKQIDPGIKRKIEKAGSAENTFQAVAEGFLNANASRWSKAHYRHIKECFERDVYPWIGQRSLKDLSAVEVLVTLRRIVDRGAVETAARTKQFIGQAIRFGIATGHAERDVTQDLRGALPSPTKGHYHAITDSKSLGQLLRDIEAYKGNFVVRTALQLQPMLFVRPANLVMMEWNELDLELAEWRIPAEKMKMKDRHIVPLPRQAVDLLRDIEPLTGSRRYVFASNQGQNREGHISRETPGATLRRMGYKGIHTAHGFRTTASTLLHEQGFDSDKIERQLAHAERNAVKAAYCHAEYLPERKKMMQAWADYLDGLKNGADIVPIKKTG
jgi:integrase